MILRHYQSILVTSAISLTSGSLCASDLAVKIKQDGKAEEFEIAADEFECRIDNGLAHPVKFAKKATKRALAAQSKLYGKNVKTSFVLYPKGKARTALNRRVLTQQILVQLQDPTAIRRLKKIKGVVHIDRPAFAKNVAIVQLRSANESLSCIEDITNTEGVLSAEILLAKQSELKLTPNDPYFAYDAGNSGYQWHLNNTGQNGGQAGLDLNITSIWDSYTGAGIKIGVVDDGLEVTHPDLNVDTANDYDWNDATPEDPTPATGQNHGTAVAGVAAAIGNNGVGVSGVAPSAQLVGLRLKAASVTDAQEAAALAWDVDISSNSWGPSDTVTTYEDSGSLVKASLANAVATGRGGKGTIFTWAAGNGKTVFNGGLETEDNSNYDGFANRRETIAVGAVNDMAESASEKGANVVCVGLSSISPGDQTITTTDLSAGYRSTFGGTSAATPQVSGVCALMLEANSNLGWRDVQEILMASARKVDEADTDWFFNGGGLSLNHKFGAGLVDAEAAVNTALTWTNLAAATTNTLTQSSLSLAIPDNSLSGVTRTFGFSSQANLRVEHVEVSVDITHPAVGDLEITLISPSGKRSTLSETHLDASSNLSWTYMTVHHWGEDSQGTWSMEIRDLGEADSGTLNSVEIKLHGVAVAAASRAPFLTGRASITTAVGKPVIHSVSTTGTPTSFSATGLPDGLFINESGVISGTAHVAGTYQAVLTTTGAGGSSEGVLTINVVTDPESDVAQAIDWDNRDISLSGQTHWSSQDAFSSDGVDAAVSSGLLDNQSATISAEVEGPGDLSFQWKVSSEADYDYLEFLIDGVVQDRISGDIDWQLKNVSIPAGSHSIAWRYRRDAADSDNLNSAWIDQVNYVQDGSYQEWAATQFTVAELANPLISGMTANPDNDFADNLAEFFNGTNPTNFGQSTLSATASYSSNQATVSYQVDSNLKGITHAIESSTDLLNWTPAASTLESTTGSTQTREASFATTPEKQFFRLRVVAEE